MAKIKIGIIGCGKITQAHHLPSLVPLKKEYDIIALYDVKKAAAEKCVTDFKLKAKIYKSLEEFLDSGIEAVVIATPNHMHHPLTIACLKKKLNVLVEKPMAVDLKQADEMIALAKKNKVILQVNQSFHFIPAYVKIKELIDAGKLGNILTARCLRAGTDSPDKAWSPGATWFIKKRSHGGIVMDIAVHMADLLQWYCGPVSSLSAVSRIVRKEHEVPDHVSVAFDFVSGATGTLDLSWTFPVGANTLEFYGDKGAIRLCPDGSFEIAQVGGSFKKLDLSKVKCKNSHQCFAEAIRGGKAVSPLAVGRNALALCLAINDSSKKRGTVKPEVSKG